MPAQATAQGKGNPDLSEYRTIKGLVEDHGDLFSEFQIRWALRNHEGKCPLKIDWLAVKGLTASAPRVLHQFREGRKPPLSDHDPIGVDVATPTT